MGSPIDSWEGVEAYFTFADKPAVVGLILVVSIVVCIGVIASTFKHEGESYVDYKD